MEPAKVKFWHIRFREPTVWSFQDGCLRYQRGVMPKGGITICRLTVDGQTSYGFAVCSLLDCYCKAKGRLIAEGRARKAIEEETLLLSTERMPTMDGIKTGEVIREFVKRDMQWRSEKLIARLQEMATA